MSAAIKHVSDQSFEVDVIQSGVPVVVEFWAEWCGPCKAMNPLLEEISVEYAGRLIVAKVNADQNKLSLTNYNVRGIPAMILFKNGVECGRVVGVISKTRFVAFLAPHLEGEREIAE
jgi:thioredoxin 1